MQVAALRKALGRDARGRDWIVTIPRVGYRLLLPEDSAPALPQKPTLAILPFANLNGDADQDWFAAGVAQDIATALSRFRSFAVLARNTATPARESRQAAKDVARELGVRYILEGSVRRAGDRLRITAQLVDEDGTHLWADGFDGAASAVFDFQDSITEAVATKVAPSIQRAEIERSRRLRAGSVSSYDIYLRAMAKIATESERENAEALVLLKQGLEADPHNAHLNAMAAWVLEHRITMGWASLVEDARAQCYEYARRGLERAEGDPAVTAHCAMSLIQVARKYDWGMAVLDAAVEANPNNMMVMTSAGVANLHCGEIRIAQELLLRAIRLSPRDLLTHISLSGLAHASLILGDHEAALVWAARALAVNPNFDPIYWMLVAANAHLGRLDEARRYLAELQRIAPGVTIERIRAGQPAKDPSRLGPILAGLRLAGLPED